MSNHNWQHAGMSARQNLSNNIKAMLEDGQSVRSWALEKKLPVKLIDRVTKDETAITLDTLELIAQQCGIPAGYLISAPHTPGGLSAEALMIAREFDKVPELTDEQEAARNILFTNVLLLIQAAAQPERSGMPALPPRQKPIAEPTPRKKKQP